MPGPCLPGSLVLWQQCARTPVHSSRAFCEVEVTSLAMKEAEGLEATQFSQVTCEMRVKCLEEEVACLKGENDRLKVSLVRQHRI